MDVFHLILLAFLAEAIWETLKMVWQRISFTLMYWELIIGIILALSTD